MITNSLVEIGFDRTINLPPPSMHNKAQKSTIKHKNPPTLHPAPAPL